MMYVLDVKGAFSAPSFRPVTSSVNNSVGSISIYLPMIYTNDLASASSRDEDDAAKCVGLLLKWMRSRSATPEVVSYNYLMTIVRTRQSLYDEYDPTANRGEFHYVFERSGAMRGRVSSSFLAGKGHKGSERAS